MIKHSESTDRSTVYVFDTLELRMSEPVTSGSPATTDYTLDEWTEVPYLFVSGVRLARVVYNDDSPEIAGNETHVFLEIGDHLGSTRIVIDRETGELVERGTYQPYGSAESDYRPDRWQEFREDYRFTGKEEDVQVGLTYFGKRFLSPYLNRWVSADPLTIHGLGGDLNLYAYVSGRALKATDPLGLEEDHEAQMSFAANATSSDGFATDAGAKTGGAVEVPAPYADPRKTAPVPEPRPGAIAKSAGTGGTGGGEGAGGGSAVRQKSAVDRFQEGEREAIQRELDEAFAKNTENLGFPEAREWADKFWNSEPIPGLGDRIGPEGGKFIATLSLKVELTPLRSQLPAFDGKTTVGALSTPDGGRVWFQSGGADSAYRNYIAAGHVEGQAAIWMRENGISRATLFQNNTNGICGYCDSQVATLLAKDAKLTVISPSGAVPNNSRAVATPKTYTGNSRDPKPAP